MGEKIDFESKHRIHANRLEMDNTVERENKSSHKMESAAEARASKIFGRRQKARKTRTNLVLKKQAYLQKGNQALKNLDIYEASSGSLETPAATGVFTRESHGKENSVQHSQVDITNERDRAIPVQG